MKEKEGGVPWSWLAPETYLALSCFLLCKVCLLRRFCRPSAMVGSEMRAWPKFITSATIALAYSAEAADVVLLTSMYLGIGRSLKVSLLALGSLAMYRGLVQVRRGDDSFERQCLTHFALPTYRCCLYVSIIAFQTTPPSAPGFARGVHFSTKGPVFHVKVPFPQCPCTATPHVQAGTTPFAGMLGDRVNRNYLVALGTLLWGCFSAGFGLSQNYSQARSNSCPGLPQRSVSTAGMYVLGDCVKQAYLLALGSLLVSTGGCCRRAGTLGLYCRALPDRQTGHGCRA